MGSIDIKLENDEYIMGESVGGTVVNINRIRCSCQKYIKFLASGTERTKIMESTSTITGSYSQSLYEEKNTFFVHDLYDILSSAIKRVANNKPGFAKGSWSFPFELHFLIAAWNHIKENMFL